MPKTVAPKEVDLSEFIAAARKGGGRCWHSQLAGLSPEQLAKLDAALESPFISGSAIAAVLKGWGLPIRPEAVQRHRRHQCSCD